MSFSELLLIIAFIVFVVAAIGLSFGKKVDLIAVGLALWSLADLITRLSSITLSTILLILAFVAFVLAAIGWRYKKVGLIAVGLAFWTASIVVPMFIH